MKPRVAIVAPGAMGSAIGQRLDRHGFQVLTSLEGRSAASVERARQCGMHHRPDVELAHADIFLSIVPPAEAIHLARRFAPLFREHGRAPVYVDCNAINPRNAQEVARIVLDSGAAFVDGGIIGGPPRPAAPGPMLYCSGRAAPAVTVLREGGLRVRVLSDRLGDASALKMSYAGITKGLVALAAAMMLGASRNGTAQALYEELAESQPHLLKHFARTIPDMYGKAYRWVEEMEEIAGFLAPDESAQRLFDGAARLYERLARDHGGEGQEIAALGAFLALQAKPASPG
jgi:3-hydroxyisobutyrate dehydrogenase-like beta-hydroxyacid dehydrogenase